MPAPYRHLRLDDRRVIFRMINEDRSIDEIAERTGYHRSTIYREIARNKVTPDRENRPFHYSKHERTEGYFPVTADEIARQRRQRQAKLIAQPELCQHVLGRLQTGWSPQQIAGRLTREDSGLGRVCHETIYQYAYSAVGRAAGVAKWLPQARKRRRPRIGRKPRASFVPAELAIQHRPETVQNREEFGHWEGDLMIFRRANGKANISTVTERKTRYTILLQNPDRQSEPLVDAISRSLQNLPKHACKTITFDRGTEFAAYRRLTETHGFGVYFCDPHSPWQKGGVENTNGRVRRYLPSETDLGQQPADALTRLSEQLNNTPRRCLAYKTPAEAFQQQLAINRRIG